MELKENLKGEKKNKDVNKGVVTEDGIKRESEAKKESCERPKTF